MATAELRAARSWSEQTVAITGNASGLAAAMTAYFRSHGATVIALDLKPTAPAGVPEAQEQRLDLRTCVVTDLANVERALPANQSINILSQLRWLHGQHQSA